jgi:thiol-disulfide isomerase/thioredoxin
MPTCKHYIGLVLLLFAWHLSAAQPPNDSVFNDLALRPAVHSGQPVLFVFLSPECPLCQNYTVALNKLDRQYAGKIKIYGIIPGKSYGKAEITEFSQKYKINYPLMADASLRLSRYLQASTTPEAILLSSSDELIYKGAIDNWFQALGRSRGRPTENYLQDAIARALRQEPAVVKRTVPVGCLINDF